MANREGIVPSKDLTHDDVMKMLGDESTAMAEQAKFVMSYDFQQAINCCGLTSVAYALTSIGCPTTVDELFLTVGVNVESAVGDGMTLAEIHDATLRYIDRSGLPIFVQCYHFDTPTEKKVATPQGFHDAIVAEGNAGIDDVMVLNFHSGIAHGWQTGGGGHFSVLMGLDSDTNSIVMSDVHGIKYGKFWSCPEQQMFRAMADKDSCGRARGALRFGRKTTEDGGVGAKELLPGLTPTLIDWTTPPSHQHKAYNVKILRTYIPRDWDALLGSRNMEGVSALTAAVRLLEGDDARIAHMDEIMRALNESYVNQLNEFAMPLKILSMAKRLTDSGLLHATTTLKKVEGYSSDALRKALKQVKCGHKNVAVLVTYNVNKAIGYEIIKEDKEAEAAALAHGSKSWSLIAGYDAQAEDDADNGILLAPAHNVIVMGRMWGTSYNRMVEGMKAIGSGVCSLVVITKNGHENGR